MSTNTNVSAKEFLERDFRQYLESLGGHKPTPEAFLKIKSIYYMGALSGVSFARSEMEGKPDALLRQAVGVAFTRVAKIIMETLLDEISVNALAESLTANPPPSEPKTEDRKG